MNSIRDSRLHFLDGLRGWGALVVLLAHTFGEGFPISDRVTLILSRMGIFNAGLAVWVFFVVSGFSLSIGFCRRHDPTILTGISLGRYARLAVPILVVALLLYLFFALGLVPSVEHRLPIFQAFLPTGPTLLNVFRFSLFDVFFAYDPAKTLIGPLWTMSFELWGSALVIGTLFVAGRLDRRVYLYAVLGVVTFLVDPIYTAFIIGLVLAEVHASGVMERNHSLWGKALLLIFGAGILCAGFLPVIGNRPGGIFGRCCHADGVVGIQQANLEFSFWRPQSLSGSHIVSALPDTWTAFPRVWQQCLSMDRGPDSRSEAVVKPLDCRDLHRVRDITVFCGPAWDHRCKEVQRLHHVSPWATIVWGDYLLTLRRPGPTTPASSRTGLRHPIATIPLGLVQRFVGAHAFPLRRKLGACLDLQSTAPTHAHRLNRYPPNQIASASRRSHGRMNPCRKLAHQLPGRRAHFLQRLLDDGRQG